MCIHLDSGATRSFTSLPFIRNLRIKKKTIPEGRQILLANGLTATAQQDCDFAIIFDAKTETMTFLLLLQMMEPLLLGIDFLQHVRAQLQIGPKFTQSAPSANNANRVSYCDITF